MWKASHSELLLGETGQLEDPGCNPDVLFEAYETTIHNQWLDEDGEEGDTSVANTLFAGLTYCGLGDYPQEQRDYHIARTKNVSGLSHSL